MIWAKDVFNWLRKWTCNKHIACFERALVWTFEISKKQQNQHQSSKHSKTEIQKPIARSEKDDESSENTISGL